MKSGIVNLIFIGIVVGLGLLSGLSNIPGEWYASLVKPSFSPPNWIFGPVWTVLYVLIGIAGARVWLKARNSRAMALWFAQMVFNIAWSPAFFAMQSTGLGLMVILPLLALILAFIWSVRGIDRLAMACFIPYALWVSFATLLNLSLFFLN